MTLMTAESEAAGDKAVPRTWPRRAAMVAVLLLVLSVVVLAFIENATPARLTSSTPTEGDRLTAAPPTVSLTFNGPLNPDRTHVTVATASGVSVGNGAAETAGRTVTQPVAVAAGGRYLIAYHVTFGDGRDLSGLFAFNVGTGTADDPAASGQGSVPVPTGPPSGAVSGGPDTGAGHSHGDPDPLTLTVIAVDLAVAAVVLWVLHRRRRNR
jgi:methionine-rich copper-binding protein CopC